MTKITIDRSTVEQALEALKGLRLGMPDSVLARSLDQRIDALRAALAEPEPPIGKASTDVGVPVYVLKKAEPQEPCNKSCAPGYCYCDGIKEAT